MRKCLLLALLPLFLVGCASTRDLEVVENFDADRYMGVWYETARFPHRFEKGMSAVSATYSINDDGTINVLNKGYVDAKEEWKDIEGVAKFKGDPDVGWLKVSFFKPFYASYKIVHLNEAYTRAIVTGPSYGYLWILSRDAEIPQSERDELVAKAKAMGFDVDTLIFVDQSKNR